MPIAIKIEHIAELRKKRFAFMWTTIIERNNESILQRSIYSYYYVVTHILKLRKILIKKLRNSLQMHYVA